MAAGKDLLRVVTLVKDLKIQMPRQPWLLWYPWGYSVPELNAWEMGSEAPELEMVVDCPKDTGCFGTLCGARW